MLANYHTHTWRCRHAAPDERAYIEQAIAAGIKILGFSDHSPYPFPDGHTSFHRMAVDQVEEYFRVLTDLKQEYAGQIQLHIGFEAEYYPAHFDGLLALLRQYPCEYLILGQHFPGNEDLNRPATRLTDDPAQLTGYVDQVLEGLSTGAFTYLAHPDMFNWAGDEALYRQEMTRLCRQVKALGLPLEINLLGLYDHRNYPCDRFWRIAGEVGSAVILGCDAHVPEALNRPQTEADGLAIAQRHGLQVLQSVELKAV